MHIQTTISDDLVARILEGQPSGRYRLVVAAHRLTPLYESARRKTADDVEIGLSTETVILIQAEVHSAGRPLAPHEIARSAAREFLTQLGGRAFDTSEATLAEHIERAAQEIARLRLGKPLLTGYAGVERAVEILNEAAHNGCQSWHIEPLVEIGDGMSSGGFVVVGDPDRNSDLTTLEALAVAEKYLREMRGKE